MDGWVYQPFSSQQKEAIGKRLVNLVVPQELQHEEADILARIGKGEIISHFTTTRQRRDGSKVAVSVAVAPIRNARGKVIGASKTVRDITEQKAAEDKTTVPGHARGTQHRDHAAGAGQGHHAQPSGLHLGHQARARVADSGRARVAYVSDALALRQAVDHPALRLLADVFHNAVDGKTFDEAFTDLRRWGAEGLLVHRETVFEGLESCVDALNGLFTGANIGKMLVKVSEPSAG